jgi:hypothetical protein
MERTKKHTIGRYPMPRKIWKMNTMAVAPYAAGFVPVDRRIAARMKHSDKPAAENMSSGRRP